MGRTCDEAFVTTVAHDLKDPIAAIVMGAALLARTLPDDQASARTLAEAILRSAERASRMVDDVRDLCLLDGGRFELELGRHDAREIAEQASSLRADEAQKRAVAVDVSVEPGLGVRADRDQLVRALGKLIDNAIRFTRAGGSVRVRVERSGAMARFSVTDEGPGIAVERHQALFDLDGGGADSHTRDGPGLSLPLTRRLIDLHGGQVTLESRPDAGSTFALTVELA